MRRIVSVLPVLCAVMSVESADASYHARVREGEVGDDRSELRRSYLRLPWCTVLTSVPLRISFRIGRWKLRS